MKKLYSIILSILLIIESTKLTIASETDIVENFVTAHGIQITNIRDANHIMIKQIQTLPIGYKFTQVELQYAPDGETVTKRIDTYPKNSEFIKVEFEFDPDSDGTILTKRINTYSDGSQRSFFFTEGVLVKIIRIDINGMHTIDIINPDGSITTTILDSYENPPAKRSRD